MSLESRCPETQVPPKDTDQLLREWLSLDLSTSEESYFRIWPLRARSDSLTRTDLAVIQDEVQQRLRKHGLAYQMRERDGVAQALIGHDNPIVILNDAALDSIGMDPGELERLMREGGPVFIPRGDSVQDCITIVPPVWSEDTEPALALLKAFVRYLEHRKETKDGESGTE